MVFRAFDVGVNPSSEYYRYSTGGRRTDVSLTDMIMENPQFHGLAIRSIVAINVAIQNLRLYPESGTVNIAAIESAYRSVLNALEHRDPLVFTETDGDLLICWEPLRENEQKNISVLAFKELMVSIGIRSITFTKGLEEAEFRNFLEIIISNPEDMTRRGGARENNNLPKHPAYPCRLREAWR